MWRAFAFLCCRNQDKAAGTKPGPNKEAAKGAVAGAGGGNEIGFMTEAKDWAGELISGQSTTGRILVSTIFFAYNLSVIFQINVHEAALERQGCDCFDHSTTIHSRI